MTVLARRIVNLGELNFKKVENPENQQELLLVVSVHRSTQQTVINVIFIDIII